MLKALGFVSGSALVGAALYVITQMPQVISTSTEGEDNRRQLKRLVVETGQQLHTNIGTLAAKAENSPGTRPQTRPVATENIPTPVRASPASKALSQPHSPLDNREDSEPLSSPLLPPPAEAPQRTLQPRTSPQSVAVTGSAAIPVAPLAKRSQPSVPAVSGKDSQTQVSITPPVKIEKSGSAAARTLTAVTFPKPYTVQASSADLSRGRLAPEQSSTKRPATEQPGTAISRSHSDIRLNSATVDRIGTLLAAPAANTAGSGSAEGAPGDDPFADTLAGRSESGWQPVWRSFHSELSASGFTRQLQLRTGREFRVVNRGPGDYQIQLGYRDADDLAAAMLEVRDKTGLSLAVD